MATTPQETAPAPPADPQALMRSRAYLLLLLLAVALGVPIAAMAFGFLKLTDLVQQWMYTDVPRLLGQGDSPARWWPLVPLALAGLLVGLTVRYLPGAGGESPAAGFAAGGAPPAPSALPGILLASVAGIGLGAVIGPEAPLIALGGGLAFLAVRLGRREVPARAAAVIAGTGSFAAISTLLGTPLAGAFLLLEATAVGGTLATAVLLPGLLGAGVGALVFTGLGSVTGYTGYSLAIPDLPAVGTPTIAEFGWAVVIGVAGGALSVGLRRLALALAGPVAARPVPATVLVALAVGGLAIGYAAVTGHGDADVLFSGQSALPGLVEGSSGYTVGTLLLLLVCKGLAYSLTLSAFRGGPTFPAMFLGAAGGIALAHLPGLALVPAVAMGIGAMTAATLRLPMSAVLLTTLFLGSDGLPVVPLTVVAAVVGFLTANLLPTRPAGTPAAAAGPAPGTPGIPDPRAPAAPARAEEPGERRG
jgi:H+/Cl- antiporter ClcA